VTTAVSRDRRVEGGLFVDGARGWPAARWRDTLPFAPTPRAGVAQSVERQPSNQEGLSAVLSSWIPRTNRPFQSQLGSLRDSVKSALQRQMCKPVNAARVKRPAACAEGRRPVNKRGARFHFKTGKVEALWKRCRRGHRDRLGPIQARPGGVGRLGSRLDLDMSSGRQRRSPPSIHSSGGMRRPRVV
jgi:hypothetical protein